MSAAARAGTDRHPAALPLHGPVRLVGQPIGSVTQVSGVRWRTWCCAVPERAASPTSRIDLAWRKLQVRWLILPRRSCWWWKMNQSSDLWRTVVEDAGLEAIEAGNADEAIRILESRNDIRIVFTDIDMPGSMDGMKLAACIRVRWPPVQIVVTSGYFAGKDLALPARSLFFPKPYSTRAVAEALRRVAL
jgi:CheY-like chemotaxis protein